LYQLIGTALFQESFEGPSLWSNPLARKTSIVFTAFQDTAVALGILMITFSLNKKGAGAKPCAGADVTFRGRTCG